MRHRKRRLAAVTVGAALLGLVLSSTAASAQPASPDTGQPAYQISLNGQSISSQELLAQVAGSDLRVKLTLITGDQVVVSLNRAGDPVVREVIAAPRDTGADVVFYTLTRHEQVYVLPSDALSLVGADVLDWELFNLTKLADLAAAGTTGEVPVIITYRSAFAAQRAPAAVSGATVGQTLASINGAAVTIDGGGDWWQEVQEATEEAPTGVASALTASGPLAGVEKVWLDELAEIHLDDSVGQVGAPIAWGNDLDGTGVTVAVLDTGIDPNHPDVAGKVIAAVDFTDSSPSAADGHGHGTHVAATIAGTGDASNGVRPGVAPGADLLVGKVCTDGGSCPNSAVIAGMEWAALQGARVANMSLGGGATDGTDPMSMAVNELTAQYGTLYVISAGNSGPGAYTVGAPGAADAALTVAAVDKDDEMADFSSRGPRVGDDAAKPDIAAPGVDIVAARAAGTAMGTVVDNYYTTASGTSMAAPHVAGGAAIIAQQHPDLSGPDLKALLMGTALDLGHDLYAQGTGRMDLGRAVDPSVFAGGSVSFGRLTYPHSPATNQVWFINVTDEPITLSLATEFIAGDGSSAPAGLFTVAADEVTVPAEGEVAVDITVDGRVLEQGGVYGKYNGWVQAFDDEDTLRTAARVSVFLEPERFQVEVDILGADPSTTWEPLLIVPMDDQTHLHDEPLVLDAGAQVTADLFAGTYAVAASLAWNADGVAQTTLLVDPEVVVDGPTSVTLNVADTERVAVQAPKQLTQTYRALLGLERTSATGAWGLTASLENTTAEGEPHWWVLPTGSVSEGTLSVTTEVVLVPIQTTLRAVGSGPPVTLDTRYVSPDVSVSGGTQVWVVDPETEQEVRHMRHIQLPVPRLTAKGTVPVVHAGAGTASELARVNVDKHLVLLTATDICTAVTCDYDALRERVVAAADQGALGVLVAGPSGHVTLPSPQVSENIDCGTGPEGCPPVELYSPVPVLSVPTDAAAALVDKLNRPGAVRVQVNGNAEVDEVYALSFADDRVPSMPYRVDRQDLVRTEHRIHDDQPGEVRIFDWARITEATQETANALSLPRVATPGTLIVHVPQQPAEAVDRFQLGTYDFVAPYLAGISTQEANSQMSTVDAEQYLGSLTAGTYTWNSGPRVPGVGLTASSESGFEYTAGLCPGCREGNTFWPSVYLTGSAGQPTSTMVGLTNDTGAGTFMLGVNGCNDCEITLHDGAGEELTQTLFPIDFSFSLSDPTQVVPAGQRPSGQLPEVFMGGLGVGLIGKEATR